MMGDRLRARPPRAPDRRADFGGAAMQRLAAALEQAVVGGVLDQRVLEAIVRLRAARPRRTGGRRRRAAPTTLAAPARRVRRRRAAACRRNRVQEPRRSARPRAPRRAGRGARRATAARSAGWPERRPARRVQEAGASPPRRTAARRRCARSPSRRPLAESACCAAISPTMREPRRDRAAQAKRLWCERILQGARNSGRVVATRSSGACAPRSASAWMRSSDVGSAQCRSSKASTTGWVLAPARSRAIIAASCRRRSSSGAEFRRRVPRAAEYRAAAREVAPYSLDVELYLGERRLEVGEPLFGWNILTAEASRPHSATGCRGVFCRSWDEFHSTQVCGVSPSRDGTPRSSRDLPRPGSPTIRTNWPSPARTRSQRRSSVPMSSSRPTKDVRARAPPLRPPPLARTMR